MQFDKLPVNKIRKARIRYYEKDKGCEIPEIEAYTFFLKVHDTYINLTHPFDECNVYDRSIYTNSTKSGEDFGNRLVLVNGKEEDGICYILEPSLDAFNDRDYISVEELEREIVYNMSVFYFDRWDLAFGDRKDCTTILERLRIFKGDSTRREKFLKYLESKENEKKLKK